jgi:ubiquinone/menaquinone biosynthesis C-methylase UbiE
MQDALIVLLVLGVIALAGVFLYWQLVVAEGAYLGTRVVALLYDWFAPRYDGVKQYDKAEDALMLAEPILRHIRTTPHPTLSQRERAFSSLPSGEGLGVKVLDVATGTGRLPDALLTQPRFKGSIIALDASAGMLALAREKLCRHGDRIEFAQHDAQKLPYPDASFDVVTCLEALEFMRDWRGAVKEMMRVLKPGGLLMLSNRIGPDMWKLPGRALPTPAFCDWLREIDLKNVERRAWLVDYDLVTGIKSK